MLLNRVFRLLLLFFLLFFLLGADKHEPAQISGIKGKLLANVKSRLKELASAKALEDLSNQELEQQVLKAMQPYGYFKPSTQITRKGKTLAINIQPGPRLMISRLSVSIIGEGSNNYLIQKAQQQIPIKQGNALNTVKYEATKQLLMNTAENQGYLHSSFEKAEILIDEQHYTATINLVFNTGPQYFFGQVQFDPTYISPALLHRYIPFDYGQPYSTEELMSLNDTLISSGYFKSVNVKPQNSIDNTIPVQVHLEPIAPINYSLGLGFGTDTGPRGRAGMHIVPVNRRGDKFNLVVLGSMKENGIQTQYIFPSKKPLIDQYELSGSLSNLNYNSGYSNALLTSFAKRHKVNNFQRVLSINNLYERFNYTYQPKKEKLTLFPKASFTWQNKSGQLFSPSGYNITLNGLMANRAVLSEVNFTQVSLDAKAALMIEPIGTRFYFHTIQGITQINNIDQLPLSLALLLGGSDNLKGFDYNSIGPGKIISYGGLEIQKETKENWYLVGFYDAGDVYDPTFRQTQRDIGLGLMWVSPVGPIKIGVAQQVDNHFHRILGKTPKLVINIGPDL